VDLQLKKTAGNKWKTVPYGKKRPSARIYEEDDNLPNKTVARRDAKMEIEKTLREEDEQTSVGKWKT